MAELSKSRSEFLPRWNILKVDKVGLDRFNAFDLRLEGLARGSFYRREEGFLAGFRQGTPEYEKLLSQYLSQVENHLAGRAKELLRIPETICKSGQEYKKYVRLLLDYRKKLAELLEKFYGQSSKGKGNGNPGS